MASGLTVALSLAAALSANHGENLLALDADAPYPHSEVIKGMAVVGEVRSVADGDNWPITWGDDGLQYTAYCDGRGFGVDGTPLSTGVAVLEGSPPNHQGHNIATKTGQVPLFSSTGEVIGGGKEGRKACGMLIVSGTLYMWLRNLEQDGTGSILTWSRDYGQTWTWADWTFPDIGYPVWLSAGRNYKAAKDEYAYLYSPNGPSAYIAYDGLLLARVPVTQITDKSAYEFFAGLRNNGVPRWTTTFEERQPVFEDTDRCLRPGVTYNPGLKRYLLTMATPGAGWVQARGRHLGIFDAPTPWGPWTTVTYVEDWGAPENRFQPQFPSKWISEDGMSLQLLYSCHPNGPYQFNTLACRVVLQGDE